MNVDLKGLRQIVEEIVLEAKKKAKKSKSKKGKYENPLAGTAGGAYGKYAHTFDFSQPLGASNRLKAQGQVGWGPQTNTDDVGVDEMTEGLGAMREEAIRTVIRSVVREHVGSAWEPIAEAFHLDEEKNVWTEALEKIEATATTKRVVKGKK